MAGLLLRAAVGLGVLSQWVDAQCQAATYDVACTSTVGSTTPSIMPAGAGNHVWYTYQLVEGITYTFYGMLEDSSITGGDIDTPLDDSVLYLYTVDNGAPSANHVAYNDDGEDLPAGYNTYASRIVYTATYSGTHFAKMTPYYDGDAGSFDFIFDSTCLISQRGCEEDGGTFGVCSTAPGLETKLKCTQAAEGYSLDDAGTVKVSRTIFCDSDSSEGDGFCTSLFKSQERNCRRCHVVIKDDIITNKRWSSCN